MDTIQAIESRASVRQFSNRPIPRNVLDTILKAGTSGPSCVNAQDWAFLVVEDKETLAKMADANGRPADPLRGAAAGILICGDLSRAFPPAKDYWIIDGAIAGQNMVLAAQSLGVGSVWLGTWPEMDRVANQTKLFGLPEHIVPHSVLALGYPADDFKPRPKTEPEGRIHWEKW